MRPIFPCSQFEALGWDPGMCAKCSAMVELHEPLVPIGARLGAAMSTMLDAALAAPPKPRGPLLLNLLPCRPCGVERRFRLAAGKFACESCGSLLTDATTASAIPSASPSNAPDPTRTHPGASAAIPASAAGETDSLPTTAAQDTRGNHAPESPSSDLSTHVYGDPW